MRKDITTVPLITATRQTEICPLCKLWRDEEVRYIETLLRKEMIMDREVRLDIEKARGFCSRHLYEIVRIAETHSRVDGVIGFVTLMPTL